MGPRADAHARGNRRIVVTGGAGFIGSHLSDVLTSEGSDVLVLDDLSHGDRDLVPRDARFERVDISSGDLESLFAGWRPDVVFHLAAQTSVPTSMSDPQRDLEVNVVGTRRVLEAARATGATVVFVSSGGAVYGETRTKATERSRVDPVSYYGMHKLLGEMYVRRSGLPWAVVRPSNVFGPRQTPGADGAVVPSFVARSLAGEPMTIHGDGSQVRDFVYVDDVVGALDLVARHGTGRTWNVSSARPTTVTELADIVATATGSTVGRVHVERRAGDVRRSVISPAQLMRLGWTARTSLEDGIRRVVATSRRRDQDGARSRRDASPS